MCPSDPANAVKITEPVYQDSAQLAIDFALTLEPWEVKEFLEDWMAGKLWAEFNEWVDRAAQTEVESA